MARITYKKLLEAIDEWNRKSGLLYRDEGYLRVTNDGPVHELGQIHEQGGTGLWNLHFSDKDGSIRSCYEAVLKLPYREPPQYDLADLVLPFRSDLVLLRLLHNGPWTLKELKKDRGRALCDIADLQEALDDLVMKGWVVEEKIKRRTLYCITKKAQESLPHLQALAEIWRQP